MSFPTTKIEHLEFSRLLMGTNWFLGCSHQSKAKDRFIQEFMNRERLADIITTFMSYGVNALYGSHPWCHNLNNAVKDAEQRVGRKCHHITIPALDVRDGEDAWSSAMKMLDDYQAMGTELLMPHQMCTDALVDRRTRSLPGMEKYTKEIRDRGMVPGLSTHMPETIPYADESGLDVATYIQIYNAAGFLMQVEVDWIQRIIWNAKKPVITIKPLAAGRLDLLVGLAFVWATLREQDMVTIGTMTADEAHEAVECSMALFEKRLPNMDLQRTRSKSSVDGN